MESEFILVGAGPAGSTLAYELASQGRGVILLDKAKFPRRKTCAGGLNIRALRLLPFSLEGVIENYITGINFTRHLTSSGLRHSPEPFMVTVRRENFDYFLLQQAQRRGAIFLEQIQWHSLYQDELGVEIETSAGRIRAKFLIGADGAQSQVARKLGLQEGRTYILAFHSEIPSSIFPEQPKEIIHIDWGSVKRSYAYLFPKNNYLALGAGGYQISALELRKYHRAFLFSHWRREEENIPFSAPGFFLPLRNKRSPIHKGRCLLIGDAAGLVDPFTGEGIYSAIRSAQIVAPLLLEALQKNWSSLQPGQEAIDYYLMPELESARLFREIFNLWPSFFHKRVMKRDRWWRGLVKILKGEKSFLDVRKKLGPGGALLSLIL
ncbi:MAG: geranylgeranyl reductase family protein [Thermodesulfobacteriota bacterium]